MGESLGLNKKSLGNFFFSGLLFLLLWLALIHFPSQIITPALDPSWQGALEYFTAERFQFGTEVIFTFGPLGYLYSTVSSGYLLDSRIMLDLVTKAVFAILGVLLTQRAGIILGCFFVLTILLFSPLIVVSADSLFLFAIVLLLSLTLQYKVHRPLLFGTPVFLAFASLIKFSFLVMSTVGLISMAVYWLWRWRWLELSLILGTYLIAFEIFEIVSGQHYLGIGSYLRAGMEISTGYQKTMFLNEPIGIFIIGLASLLIVVAVLLMLAVLGRKDGRQWMSVLLYGEALFLSWKHGFIRADGHVYLFLLFCQFVLIAAWSVVKPPAIFRKTLFSLVIAGYFLSHFGIYLFMPNYNSFLIISDIWNRIVHNAFTLSNISGYIHLMQENLDVAKSKYRLPKVSSIVGMESVDVFGYEQGIALLNNLNYRPRPVFQSYSAYTPCLVKANQDFYASNRAPHFVLFKLQTIDDRFPAADDSGALESILRNYTPITFERGYSLWKGNEGPRAYAEHRLIKNGRAAFGDSFDLPPDHQVLWLKIQWETSWLGKLREFLYKPAEVTLEITTAQGQTERYRLVGPLARTGFLISPPLRNTIDVIEALSGTGGRRTASFQLKISNKSRRFFDPKFAYELYVAPDFRPWTATPEDVWQLKYWMFENAPITAEAAFPIQGISVAGQDALLAHAPSRIIFEIPKGARTVEGRFGIAPGAYDGGRTDGVEFSIEMIDSEQHVNVLFRRYLQPMGQPQDRGTQSFSLPLPESAHGQIVLRATVGTQGNAAWDWSYWTDVAIK